MPKQTNAEDGDARQERTERGRRKKGKKKLM